MSGLARGLRAAGIVVKVGCRLDLHPVPADFEQIRARAEAR
jgi:hypothetical protein